MTRPSRNLGFILILSFAVTLSLLDRPAKIAIAQSIGPKVATLGGSQTAAATSGSSPVGIISNAGGIYSEIEVDNQGTAPGFISFDSGAANSWFSIPGSATIFFHNVGISQGALIELQRNGSTDMSSVYITGH
jgi:hypothetical protein